MNEQSNPASGHRARLRKRLFEGGGKALHDHELVEYLLALAIPRRDTKDQAKALLKRFGGIGKLLAADADTLRREGLTDGVIGALKIAEASAYRLLKANIEEQPLLSNHQALADYLRATMGHGGIEQVRVLFLNAKNRLIEDETMWTGTVDQSSIHVREVIARAIALGATAIIIAHNHPSGDATPSRQDIRLTRDLIDAARHMGITVHDHVIVAAGGITSMKAQGLI